MAVLLVRGSNIDDEINLNTKDRHGKTPLDWILTMTYSKIRLVESKVMANGGKVNLDLVDQIPGMRAPPFMKDIDISISSQNDLKPLLKMALEGNFENVEELIKLGANVNSTDQFGNTALHLTSDFEIAKILVKHGALINISNLQNETPMTSAIDKGVIPIVTMLLNHRAEVTGITKNTKYLHLFGLYYKDGPELMKTLIEKGADIHARDFRKNTVLHLAISKKCLAFASWLIREKADVNAKNIFDETPLTLAIQKGSFSIAKKLMDNGAKACDLDAVYFLQNVNCQSEAEAYETFVKRLIQNGANLDAKDHLENSALHLASSMGLLKIVIALLARGIAVDSPNNVYETPLIIACQEGHLKIVKVLLGYGAKSTSINILDFMRENQHKDPHDFASVVTELIKGGTCIETLDVYENTALHFASSIGIKRIVKTLIKHGASINAKNINNLTPLDVAATKRHLDIVDYLLENGANGDSIDIVKFLKASQNSDEQQLASILIKLVVQKADILAKDQCGNSALHIASKKGFTSIVDILIKNGALVWVNVPNLQGKTPFELAAQNGHLTIMDKLLKNGTDCETKDIMTLLKDTRDIEKQKHIMIVKKMITHKGLNLHYRDEKDKNNTALHFAAALDDLKLMKLLIENGCDVNAINDENDTPLNLAFVKGHQDVIDLLLEKGATANVPNLFRAMPKVPKENECCELCIEPKNGVFAFQPCGHANACEQCCVKLTYGHGTQKKCPICRGSVKSFQRIYV